MSEQLTRAKATLNANLWVDCPNCEEAIDLFYNDPEGHYTTPIFSNNWDKLEGMEVECDECGHRFCIDNVEW